MKQAKKNIKLVSMLMVAIVILLAIIFTEWGFMRLARSNLLEEINQSSSSGYDIEALPTIDLLKNSLEDYTEMVSRPLFIEGRRPVEIDVSTGGEPIKIGEFDHLLIGVYGTEQGMSALFENSKARSGEPKYSKVYVDDDLVGWKVEEIHSDHVILSQAGGYHQAQLHKPRPKVSARDKKKERIKAREKSRSRKKTKTNEETE